MGVEGFIEYAIREVVEPPQGPEQTVELRFEVWRVKSDWPCKVWEMIGFHRTLESAREAVAGQIIQSKKRGAE
jgi:hypothetical protein